MPAGLLCLYPVIFICMKEKVLILPEMKKRNWEITNCPRWCSGITWSVSQGSRAWTFLILMETGDNQRQYGHVTHISHWWQYSSGWQYLYMVSAETISWCLNILSCSATVSSFVLLSLNGQPLSTLNLIALSSLSNLNGFLRYFIEILWCYVVVWAMEIW